MFLVLYLAARAVTQIDPQGLRIVLRSATAHGQYDAAKLTYVTVTRRPRR